MRLEIEKGVQSAIRQIKALKQKPKLIAVQVPEGLKTRALEIAEQIEKASGAEAVIFSDPCFGACDLADARARQLGADLLVHFGHTKMLISELPVIYAPLSYEFDENELANKIIAKLNELSYKKIALCATAQYAEKLNGIKKILGKKGIRAEIGVGGKRVALAGQVLGCNYSAVNSAIKDADAIVFVGDGLFHPLGISFSISKPVLIANPLAERVEELRQQRSMFLRKRYAAVALAKDAKIFGIIASTKRGQLNMRRALEIKGEIEKEGKKAYLIAGDLVKMEYLLGMQLDALVCTACPRIALDDSILFKIPIITPNELEVVFGKRSLENYKFEELQ
ncbi:MAG: diphthamide biosynthesis enzyme Dph2 [Candidatus Diapherotrites archaeon]|nr:diphthamide biosynthesis enzyme Dph2 [Candidatus Diapherotrites archaeon]